MSIASEHLDLLRKLVSTPSVFPQELAVSNMLHRILTDLGFRVEQVLTGSNRPNLVATFGSSSSYLGFYGHMDTVPPAPDYSRDPFAVEVDGDIARGLGVCDMKGGLSCILQAAAWATTERLPMKVIFGVDEEDISQGANDIIRSGKLSDVRFLIVAESGQVTDFEQPISVCLGRKGRIVFEIHVSGMAAHAAEHHKGINAIEKASELCLALRELQLPTHEKLGGSALVIQGIHAEASAFSVPDRCTISCSLLTCPGMTSAKFIDLVSHAATRKGVSATVRVKERATPYGEAFEINQSHPFYNSLNTSALKPLGVTPIFTPSVADENFFAHALQIPVLSIGPIGSGDHTKDEWVRLSSLGKVVDVYKKALSLYAAGASSW